jgi:tRNA-specific 2-thiouridylase
VKLRELLTLADRLDAARVATGHYARVDRSGPIPRLARGTDRQKDQSYFLHTLGRDALERLVFPLGESTKAEVRSEAAELRLPGALKGESQELCFVPTGRYDELVQSRAGDRARPGPIVDASGRQVGAHDGLYRYTVGQRKNLGIALGERAYVVRLDKATDTVHLGPRTELEAHGAELTDVTLAEGVALPRDVAVVVRYRGTEVRAHLSPLAGGPGGRVAMRFETPVRAVVPGQVAVFYEGDVVLGGGTIARPLGAPAEARSPATVSTEAAP